MEQERILRITLDIDDLTKQAAFLQKEIDRLNASQKQLEKEGKKGTVEYQNQANTLRTLKNSLSDTRKEIDTNYKLTKALKGSNEELRAELSKLTKQYNSLSKEERENTEVGQFLREKISSISDELKANESAIGDNRRNVGNYSDAIKGLGGVMGNISGRLDEVTATITAMSTSLRNSTVITKGLVGQLKALTVASLKFLATPIGVILGVIAGLFILVASAISRNEERMSKLSKVTAVVSGVFNALVKIVEPLADLLIDGLLAGIDLVISGLEKFENFLGITNNGLSDSIRLTQQLADAELRLAQSRREQEKTQLRFQLVAEKLRQIRDDESRSIDDRIKANRQLGKTLDQQIQSEKRLAEQALRAAKLRIQVEGESSENLDRLAEAETKLLEIAERVAGQRSEQLTNENSLLKEQTEKIKELRNNILQLNNDFRTINLEIGKLLLESEKISAGRDRDALSRRRRSLDAELKLLEINNQLELQALDEKYQQIQQKITDSGLKGKALREAQINAQILEQRDLTALIISFEQQKQNIIEDTYALESDLRSSILDQIYANSIETQRVNRLVDEDFAKSIEEKTALIRQNTAAQIAEVNKQENAEILASSEKYDALYQQLVDAGLSDEEFRQAERELIQQQEDEITRITKEAEENRTGIKKDESEKQKAIKEQLRDAELNLLDATTNAALVAADENVAATKAIASLAATASTFAAINKTLAEPTLIYPSNVIQSAAIGIQGFANVARINKLAKGGIAGGDPHSSGGTKYFGEDGNVVELERGEKWYVLNKKSSGMIGALSNLNVMGGGVPFSESSKFLRDGGAVDRTVSTNVNNNLQLIELSNALMSAKFVVSVLDINAVQNRVAVTERTATH